MDNWMDEWIVEWKNPWMNEQMDEWNFKLVISSVIGSRVSFTAL